MTTEEARDLLKRYNAGQCTEAEKALVERSFLEYNEDIADLPQEHVQKIKEEIYAKLPIHKTKTLGFWQGVAAIAAIALITFGIWNVYERFVPQQPKTEIISDVLAGGNRATLKLSDGQTINLDSNKNGVIINNRDLTYNDGTRLANVAEQANSTAPQTLTTPNGGQWQIVLSDGTKVWLNAASSLTYPVSFGSAKNRMVELKGEAFFEVSPNKAKPFIVKSATQTVEVLGTHFNINNYQDDGNTITTLVEGSVKVNSPLQKVVLKPNQQSVLSQGGIKVQEADLLTALAWKNGKIEFRDADIQTIMKQISRWYDIDVAFKGEIPQRTFNGGISRQSNLSVLLKILEYNDIHFTIEKDANSRNKLIVTP